MHSATTEQKLPSTHRTLLDLETVALSISHFEGGGMQRALVVDCVCDAHPSDYGQVGTREGVAVGHIDHIWCHLTFASNFCTNLLFCNPLSMFTPCFLILEQSLD